MSKKASLNNQTEDSKMKTLPFRYEVMDGKGEPMFIDFRRATVDDLDKVIALQK